MPIDSGNLALKGLDDLFSTEENRQEEQREQVQQIPIDALHPFTNHPFKVLDDEAMTRTVESIAQYQGEYDPERLVKRLRTVHPMTLVRDEKAMSGTVSYKYMMLILRTYNGSSRSRSLPIKQ